MTAPQRQPAVLFLLILQEPYLICSISAKTLCGKPNAYMLFLFSQLIISSLFIFELIKCGTNIAAAVLDSPIPIRLTIVFVDPPSSIKRCNGGISLALNLINSDILHVLICTIIVLRKAGTIFPEPALSFIWIPFRDADYHARSGAGK